MKTHYQRPFNQKDYSLCWLRNPANITDDYREATCLKCIALMSPGEQMWHDKNNPEWIKHKAKDGRRKGVEGKTKTIASKLPDVGDDIQLDIEWPHCNENFVQENWKFLVCMFFILLAVMWCAL
jgi:hypothetical protein